jgi:hypothetical protein
VTLEDLILPIAVSGGVASAISVAAWKLFTRYYVPVPPNRALVLYGRRSSGTGNARGAGPGAVELRSPRILVGGGAYVPPWRKGAGFLSLEPVDADATVRVRATGADPLGSGWEAVVSVQVKIPAEPGMLRAAAENLLGKSAEEIRKLVCRAVEGATPPLLIRLSTADGNFDWEQLATEIQASVARDLVADGLVIRTVAIKELRRLPGLGWDLARRDGASPPPEELPAEASDTPVRLTAVESRLDQAERTLDYLGAALGRTRARPAYFPEPPALLPYDPAGGDLPSRLHRAPVPVVLGGGAERGVLPLDAKQ